jgi:phosphoglycolate phosphatase-like HAD superfamily hydrolase
VLFDIDGTLLSTSLVDGSEKRRYVETMRKVVGKEPCVVPSRFAGMVDPQISKILLTELGLSDDDVRIFLPKVLARMGEVYRNMEKKIVLNSGVRGLLAVLATSPRHVTGVLTGNLTDVAEEKLARTDIRVYFSELFCADAYFERTSLVENAVRTCMTRYNLEARKDVVIVGDTPRDIVAANVSSVTPIGVSSGPYSMSQLSEAGAVHVFANLESSKDLLVALGLMQ